MTRRSKSFIITLSEVALLSLATLMVSDIKKAPDPIVFDDYRALDMVVPLPKDKQ